MSDELQTAPDRARCEVCGSTRTLLLVPSLCADCTNGPQAGEPWKPGEVGYEVRMSADQAERLSGVRPELDPFVVGPLRSRETADELARVWLAELVEVVPVPPETFRVGTDLVTVD